MMKQRTNPENWMQISINGEEVFQKVDQFPDGSFRWNLLDAPFSAYRPHVKITLKTTLPEAMVGLYQVLTAIDAMYRGSYVTLVVQTVPDQRADRAEVSGMSIPAQATAALLAGTNVETIILYDPHSPVFVAYLREFFDETIIVKNVDVLFNEKASELSREPTHIVAVDAGAIERAHAVAGLYNIPVIYMDKVRENGRIIGHEITAFSEAPNHESVVWIVDDLCDGGATFISAANALAERFEYEELNLYVTHGLFSKSKSELYNYFDKVMAYFDYE